MAQNHSHSPLGEGGKGSPPLGAAGAPPAPPSWRALLLAAAASLGAAAVALAVLRDALGGAVPGLLALRGAVAAAPVRVGLALATLYTLKHAWSLPGATPMNALAGALFGGARVAPALAALTTAGAAGA
jgi:hypothetical protein